MADVVSITTPVGRLVGGSPYEANTKDYEGNPLVIKSGPNAGQPRVNYYCGIAIPKTPGKHWMSEDWGQKLVAVARRDFPALFNPATGMIWEGRQFAFKVTDGDSQVPNRSNHRPCDFEGYPGHWVMNWSNGFAPKCYNADGSAPLPDGAIKRGYYVQGNGTVDGNGSDGQPGLYLNIKMLALRGIGPEIVSGPDPKAVGFGAGALPPGASAAPAGMVMTGPDPRAAGFGAPAPASVVATTPAPALAGVTPAHDLVQPGMAGPPPPAPVVAPVAAPVVERYSVNGTIYTRDQLLAMPGWTPDHLANCQRVA